MGNCFGSPDIDDDDAPKQYSWDTRADINPDVRGNTRRTTFVWFCCTYLGVLYFKILIFFIKTIVRFIMPCTVIGLRVQGFGWADVGEDARVYWRSDVYLGTSEELQSVSFYWFVFIFVIFVLVCFVLFFSFFPSLDNSWQTTTNNRRYLFDHMSAVNVDDCEDCTIFIGPTNSSVFIRDCKNCK